MSERIWAIISVISSNIYVHLYIYIYIYTFFFFCCGAATQRGSWPPHSWGFLDHTQRRTTVGRTPLDEWSARRRDLYLKTHNTHNRKTPMPPVGFEPTISASQRPQTYALHRAATGTGINPTLITFNHTTTRNRIFHITVTEDSWLNWLTLR